MNGNGFRLEEVSDKRWLAAFIRERWGDPGIISNGTLHNSEQLSAIRATDGADLYGVATWFPNNGSIELVTLDSLKPGRGVGTALIDAVVKVAREARSNRLWLITSNDNIEAIRFYQKRGWRLSALRPGAMIENRRLKPAIPEVGNHGIPIRDEIELEYPL